MPAATRWEPTTSAGDRFDGGLDAVPLRVEQPAAIDLATVDAVLGAPLASWLGERIDNDELGRRRFACDLELAVGQGDRRAEFHKSAIVTLGDPVDLGAARQIPVEWRAASLAPLFPVFVGRMTLARSSVRLDGYYAPPLGLLGVAIDRAMLGAGARRVARWFLWRVIEAIDMQR